MRAGVAISGTAHGALLAFAIWGADWFSPQDPAPFTVTEIELVEGQDFEAAISTAPVVPSDGPAELAEPSDGQAAPESIETPVDPLEASSAPELPPADVPQERPDPPEVAFAPPPTDIPTEAPAPSIAEIPSADPLREQSTEPESPSATEPQKTVAAVKAPLPNARPILPPPPEPEPEDPNPQREAATLVTEAATPEAPDTPRVRRPTPEANDADTPQDLADAASALPQPKIVRPAPAASQPQRETATLADTQQPLPEASDALTPSTTSEAPSTDPLQPLASLAAPQPRTRPQRPPEPEPEPQQAEEQPASPPRPEASETARPDPEAKPTEEAVSVAEAEVEAEAPSGPAPQEARLPVARPADKARAARAVAAREQQRQDAAAQTAEAEEPKPSGETRTAETSSNPAGGSSARLAARLTRGERNALRVGIKKYYTYSGDRSDRSLEVTIRVQLGRDGKVRGKPEQRSASGGNSATQRALFQAGRRAILRASSAGEFQRLPLDKYDRWKTLNFQFTVNGLKVAS